MKSIVVANWKMNPPTFAEAKKLFDATKQAAAKAPGVALIVAPPALYLHELAAHYRGAIAFAAQDAHAEPSGPHTGETSVAQVRDAKASYVLVGHSERRAAGESDDDTRKKIAAVLALKMTPILCVGEARRTASGEHFTIVREQLRAGFADVSPARAPRVVVAYEPVWAIGGEKAMRPRDMHEMAIFIRKSVVDAYGGIGHSVKILYGGAVNEENAPAMMREGEVHGLLVGHVSTDIERFGALLRSLKTI